MKLEHVSPSTLGQAARCGEQLRFRLEEGPEPPGFSLIRGRAVHKSIEANMLAKLRGYDQPSIADLDSITSDEVSRSLAAGEFRLDLEVDGERLTLSEATDQTIDDAISLSRLHATEVAPAITPTAVEARVELESPELPVKLVGVLDLIALSGDGEAIRDAKTTAKKPNASAVADSDQLTAYDALYRGLRGVAPRALVLDQLVLPSAKLPARYFEQTAPARDEADFRALAGRIERVVAMVEAEIWIPAPEGSWVCSERFCGYWGRCVFARGRTRSTS